MGVGCRSETQRRGLPASCDTLASNVRGGAHLIDFGSLSGPPGSATTSATTEPPSYYRHHAEALTQDGWLRIHPPGDAWSSRGLAHCSSPTENTSLLHCCLSTSHHSSPPSRPPCSAPPAPLRSSPARPASTRPRLSRLSATSSPRSVLLLPPTPSVRFTNRLSLDNRVPRTFASGILAPVEESRILQLET